jgi:hypothetical protein
MNIRHSLLKLYFNYSYVDDLPNVEVEQNMMREYGEVGYDLFNYLKNHVQLKKYMNLNKWEDIDIAGYIIEFKQIKNKPGTYFVIRLDATLFRGSRRTEEIYFAIFCDKRANVKEVECYNFEHDSKLFGIKYENSI